MHVVICMLLYVCYYMHVICMLLYACYMHVIICILLYACYYMHVICMLYACYYMHVICMLYACYTCITSLLFGPFTMEKSAAVPPGRGNACTVPATHRNGRGVHCGSSDARAPAQQGLRAGSFFWVNISG